MRTLERRLAGPRPGHGARSRPAAVPAAVPDATVPGRLLQLQREAGNTAVTALVQRKASGALRKGAKGAAVRELQQLLNDSNLTTPIDVDGDYGKQTVTAVRQAQRKSELGVDGIAGADTLAAIRKSADQRADAAATAARTTAAGKQAEKAWSLAAQLHATGKWDDALQAYAEVVSLAAEAGLTELQTVSSVRIREARLHRPPTPYPDIVAGAAAGPEKEDAAVGAKRTLADTEYKDGKYAQSLAHSLQVYAASGGGNETDDVWSIASCHHQLGHYEDAVSWYRQLTSRFADADSDSFSSIVLERTREAVTGKPPTPGAELKAKYAAELSSAARHDPNTPALRARAAEAEGLYAGGDFKGSLDAFMDVYKGAAQFDLGVGPVMFNIGRCHHRLEHYAKAIEFYQQARESNRGQEWYIASIGRLGGDNHELVSEALETRQMAAERIADAMQHRQ